MDIKKLANNARAFNQNLGLHEATAIQLSEKTLVDINRSQMLNHKNAKDAIITPAYSNSYAAYKGFSNPDLKDTGDFQNDMFLIANTKEWFINSIDWKAPSLELRYSDIFGIAPSNKKKATEEPSNNLYQIFKQKVLNV